MALASACSDDDEDASAAESTECAGSEGGDVVVPDVVGLTLAEARRAVEAAGLLVLDQPVPDGDSAGDDAIVTAHEPPAGVSVPERACVGFRTVGEGAQPCPGTEHPWQLDPEGSPDESGDGLPQTGTATRAAAEAQLPSQGAGGDGAVRAYVRADAGRTWDDSSGAVEIVDETIYTVVYELASIEACPAAPAFAGVPLTYVYR